MGSWDSAAIRRFLSSKSEASSVSLDRVTIARQEGKRSWPTHASVIVGDRAAEAWIGEVLDHLADIEASSASARQRTASIELRTYRATEPAGSARFRVELPQVIGAGIEEEEEERDPAAVVARVCADLLRANVELTAEMRRQGQSGFDLARASLEMVAKSQGAMMELHQRSAEATAALAIAEQGGNQGELLAKMAEQILPIVAMKMTANYSG